jgi:hypothetical protein
MFVENSRAFLLGAQASGRRGLRWSSLRDVNASKVSGPGLEHLNADNARCGTTGRSNDAVFGWKILIARYIHERSRRDR